MRQALKDFPELWKVWAEESAPETIVGQSLMPMGGLGYSNSMTLGVALYHIFILSLCDYWVFHKVTVLDKDNYKNKINYFSHCCVKNTRQKNWGTEGWFGLIVQSDVCRRMKHLVTLWWTLGRGGGWTLVLCKLSSFSSVWDPSLGKSFDHTWSEYSYLD